MVASSDKPPTNGKPPPPHNNATAINSQCDKYKQTLHVVGFYLINLFLSHSLSIGTLLFIGFQHSILCFIFWPCNYHTCPNAAINLPGIGIVAEINWLQQENTDLIEVGGWVCRPALGMFTTTSWLVGTSWSRWMALQVLITIIIIYRKQLERSQSKYRYIARWRVKLIFTPSSRSMEDPVPRRPCGPTNSVRWQSVLGPINSI